MSKAKIIDKHSENLILTERNLLMKINHPFIVNMHFSFQDNENVYLILDFLQGGDLRYHLCKKKIFTENETKFIIANIILGLEYIHFNRVIHRDIKPENIVLNSKGYAKITDFGIAKLLPENSHYFNNDSSGTPGYMAPEALCNQNQSYVEDYFALGVICYEMIIGTRPYIGKNRKEIKEKILSYQAKITKAQKELISPAGEDFINSLLQRKPGQRLGIRGDEEVKRHEWFNNFDWESVYKKRIAADFVPRNGDNYDSKYCNAEEPLNLSTMERYEEINKNMNYYNKYIFQKYTYYDVEKERASWLNSLKNKSKKQEKQEDYIVFINPHLIYEEYIDDKNIVNNLIAPALATSRSLDKKYLKFRKMSGEIMEKDKILNKPKSERKITYKCNETQKFCSERKNNHQRNKNLGNRDLLESSSQTRSMRNNNNYYI